MDRDYILRFNLLEMEPGQDVGKVADDRVSALRAQYTRTSWGPEIQRHMDCLIQTGLSVPGMRIADLPTLYEKHYQAEKMRDRALVHVENPELVRYWAEIKECVKTTQLFIPPEQIVTTINGKKLPVRKPIASVEATLATEFENGQGQYRRTRRATVIHVYEPLPAEEASLYEMGLPVVETGDRWHYDIQQRVPLNADRDNVQPSFLRDVRAAVVNALSDKVGEEDAAEPWARDATQSSRIEKQAFERVMHKRHGRKLVVRSVNDAEANHVAAAHGYEVLAGGALTGDEWRNAKRFESFQAASRAFPTDSPTSGSGSKSTTIPEEKWTPGMRRLAEYVERIGRELVGGLVVRIVRDSGNRRFSAWYSQKEITFNLQRLGHRFFNDFPANLERVNSLLLHEIAHERESDHLSDRYHSAICDFGATLTQLALDKSKLFRGAAAGRQGRSGRSQGGRGEAREAGR